MMDVKSNAPAKGAQQAKGFDCKDSYKSQYDKVLAAFSTPKTMLMVARETGIERANICRYVDIAVKLGTLFLVSYNLCAITLHVAGYYTTDKSLIRRPIQLELFDGLDEEANSEPMRLSEVMAEAGRNPVCPRSGEESLMFIISKMKGGVQ